MEKLVNGLIDAIKESPGDRSEGNVDGRHCRYRWCPSTTQLSSLVYMSANR